MANAMSPVLAVLPEKTSQQHTIGCGIWQLVRIEGQDRADAVASAPGSAESATFPPQLTRLSCTRATLAPTWTLQPCANDDFELGPNGPPGLARLQITEACSSPHSPQMERSHGTVRKQAMAGRGCWKYISCYFTVPGPVAGFPVLPEENTHLCFLHSPAFRQHHGL